MCRKLATPVRVWDFAGEFNRSVGGISGIFNDFITRMYEKWSERILQVDFGRIRTCVESLAGLFVGAGSPLPRVWGLIDGTLRHTCRPVIYEEVIYNGKDRVHGLKFQGVLTPDGIMVEFSGPYVGRQHDARIYAQSGLLQRMEQGLDHSEGFWYLYGDSAYPRSEYMITSSRMAEPRSREDRLNRVMSSLRETIEWSFGRAFTQLWLGLHDSLGVKVYLQQVARLYPMAVFLMNCKTCLDGRNEVTDYFRSSAPSLDEYLNRAGMARR